MKLLLAALLLLPCTASALYDPAPADALAAAEGVWTGTLTYRDYSDPDREVTLPTRLFVTLGAPDELVLHYIYDDGPGKTVHSYERMRFDTAAGTLLWRSGPGADDATEYRLQPTADGATPGAHFTLERTEGGEAPACVRHHIRIDASALVFEKLEGASCDALQRRNRSSFAR